MSRPLTLAYIDQYAIQPRDAFTPASERLRRILADPASDREERAFRRAVKRTPPDSYEAQQAGCALGSAGTATLLTLPLGLQDLSGAARTALWLASMALTAIVVRQELRGGLGPFPERKAQVPRHWLHWRRRTVTAIAWGALIGSGFLSLLHHATVYILALVVVLSPSLTSGVLIGVIYGTSRGGMLLLAWLRRAGPENLGTLKDEVGITVSPRILAATGGVTTVALAAVSGF